MIPGRRTSAYLLALVIILIAGLAIPAASALQCNATYDGYVRQTGGSYCWTLMRNAVGNVVSESPASFMIGGDTLASTTSDIIQTNTRGFTTYTCQNASGITIDNATLTVYTATKGNTLGNWNYTIIDANPWNPLKFMASDYHNTTFALQSNIIPYANLGSAGTMVNFTLNTNGINNIINGIQNENGNVTFIFTSDVDALNTTVTWSSAGDSYYYFKSIANAANSPSFITLNAPTPPSESGLMYYHYGHSIARATGYADLNITGFDNAILNMTRRHNATATAGHNMDGGGQPSWWGVANFATHPGTTPVPVIYFVEFIVNDRSLNSSYTGIETARNLVNICDQAIGNGSLLCYSVMDPPFPDVIGSSSWQNWSNQNDNNTIIESYLNLHGYPAIKGYDAIDSIPGNNLFDKHNLTTQSGGHPNVLGHTLLGDYIWNYLITHSFTAQFTPAGPVSVGYPNSTQFNDTSTGSPTAWNWTARNVTGNNVTFSFSTSQNPVFTPPTSGNFSISLNASTTTAFNISTQITFVNVSSQLELNTTTKLNYITISALPLPAPNFNATPRYLTSIPQSVTFNFTGQNPHPVSYVWDFGDGSTTTISAPANPNTTHIYAASGSYTVSMTATNTLGTITETKTDYISVSEPTMSIVPTPRNISYLVPVPMQVRVSGIRHADAIIGNFTYNQSAINVTQVNLNTSALSGSSLSSAYTSGYVSFNLTKPDQNYIAPTDVVDIWFNAINVNNGTEPINYDLAFPMSNGVLSNSSFTVAFYNYTTKTEGSITLENLTYARKIKFVDSSTLNMINTQIVTSYWWGVTSGNTATTDGYTTISAKYGTLTINATADAYYPTQQNIIFNTNDDYTLYITPLQSPGTQKLNVLYPREVQFKIVDAFGKPLPNVQASARMVNSTVTGTNWVATLYGIPNAANDIETTGMVGITDDIGVVVFPMIATNQYGLLFTNSTSGITSSKLVSPKDTSYVIYIPLAGQAAKNNTIAQVATSSLPWYKLNTSYYNLSMIYHDTNGYTTDVVFNVWDYTAGGTLVYTKDWGNPGTTKIVDNYTVYLPLGQEFRWQYNATKV